MPKISVEEWIENVATIDYCYFMLGQFVKNPRSQIAQMIDKATGFDLKQREDVKSLIRQVINCKKKLGEDYSGDEAVLKKIGKQLVKNR